MKKNDDQSKWPKVFPELTAAQVQISNDFMHYWHHVLGSQKKFSFIENFNHRYPLKTKKEFLTTLEIGAGLGEHLNYEKLTTLQRQNYVALELRENMADRIKENFPDIAVCVADCQAHIPFENHYFDRVIAIHVLEHLPNLPAAVKELYRLCQKDGRLEIVIPCEGGGMYSFARTISAKRLFEKRYKQSYDWFIEREHVNQPHEILEELQKFFEIEKKSYFPFLIPSVNLNLCIGITLFPKVV